MITLNELLASRDARHATQQKLLAEHSGKTLVCLTVVMPGSVKRNQQSLTAAHAAVEAMRKAFGQEQLLELDLETGYEAYLITPMPLLEAKRIAVNIEDTHPDASSTSTSSTPTACPSQETPSAKSHDAVSSATTKRATA